MRGVLRALNNGRTDSEIVSVTVFEVYTLKIASKIWALVFKLLSNLPTRRESKSR